MPRDEFMALEQVLQNFLVKTSLSLHQDPGCIGSGVTQYPRGGGVSLLPRSEGQRTSTHTGWLRLHSLWRVAGTLGLGNGTSKQKDPVPWVREFISHWLWGHTQELCKLARPTDSIPDLQKRNSSLRMMNWFLYSQRVSWKESQVSCPHRHLPAQCFPQRHSGPKRVSSATDQTSGMRKKKSKSLFSYRMLHLLRWTKDKMSPWNPEFSDLDDLLSWHWVVISLLVSVLLVSAERTH